MAVKLKKVESVNRLHKFAIWLIKISPLFLSTITMLNITLNYLGIDFNLFCYLFLQPLYSIFLLYVFSYVFKFCRYHRLFIHYLLIELILDYVNNIHEIEINDLNLMRFQIILFFFVMLYGLYLFLKKNDT